MYSSVETQPISPEKFELGQLDPHNRWVIMSELIPWSEFEEEYSSKLSSDMGAPAKPFRMALGALIIKEKLGISDRETVEQIRENPYLQYFIGLSNYSNNIPFDPSLMVYFRERISQNLVHKINQRMVKKKPEVSTEEGAEKRGVENRGKLILDASCAPSDISYPTDLGLLNQARELTEKIIDNLYQPIQGSGEKKPRTYRKKARKDYLAVARKRKPSQNQIREAIKKQLEYLRRNLGNIEKLIEKGSSLSKLSKKQYKNLLVITELYRQQLQMYEQNERRIDDRIVSINQPHVRPIIRGKSGKNVEFGAKISVSCWDGLVFLDHLSWDNFNESKDLITQIENYFEYTGAYPESVHVDQIYRTRENRQWCKERGIRMSGKPLGRPRKNVSELEKRQAAEDEKIRNQIEGKFGNAKRRFSLNRVMAQRCDTSETTIAITFLVMNLCTLLRQVFCLFLSFFRTHRLEVVFD